MKNFVLPFLFIPILFCSVVEASSVTWTAVKFIVENKTTKSKREVIAYIGEITNVPDTSISVQPIEFIPSFVMNGNTPASASDKQTNPAAKVIIYDYDKKLFEGWLFKKYSVTHMSHPNYDVKLLEGISDNKKVKHTATSNKLKTKTKTLSEAINDGDVAIVRKLLKAGADPNEIYGGIPIFHLAVMDIFDRREIIKLMLDNGVRVDIRDRDGMTPLMGSANVEIAKMLVEHGADINAKSSDGLTPVSVATINGQEDIVKYLIGLGADVKARDAHGYTALDYAKIKGHQNIIKILTDAGAK